MARGEVEGVEGWNGELVGYEVVEGGVKVEEGGGHGVRRVRGWARVRRDGVAGLKFRGLI